MTTRKEFIMQAVKAHYDEACSLGFEVVGVWLQGSQNYNCDIYTDKYQSDIDTKCIILPTLDDIVCGYSPYSSTYIRANSEHIDIKDIRVMFDMFRKANLSYLEFLFTEFYVINPKYQDLVVELMAMRERLVRAHQNQFLRCAAGMSMEKFKALEHPYPTIKDKIDKYGYDPKQLHHILRLNDLMKKYIAGKPYLECLVPDDIEFLVNIKQNIMPLEQARKLAQETDKENSRLKDEAIALTEGKEIVDREAFNLLKDLKVRFIKRFLIFEILK